MSHDDLSPPQRYHFFVLGLWVLPGQDNRPDRWRISLENPRTAERKGFADLAELDAFLAAWMAERVAVTGER